MAWLAAGAAVAIEPNNSSSFFFRIRSSLVHFSEWCWQLLNDPSLQQHSHAQPSGYCRSLPHPGVTQIPLKSGYPSFVSPVLQWSSSKSSFPRYKFFTVCISSCCTGAGAGPGDAGRDVPSRTQKIQAFHNQWSLGFSAGIHPQGSTLQLDLASKNITYLRKISPLWMQTRGYLSFSSLSFPNKKILITDNKDGSQTILIH